MIGLIGLWLLAYKGADLFNFFKTYSSLWFLPAGVTLSIALVVPIRFILAPLIANLLLAIPFVCVLLGIQHTGYLDPILHSFRLFAVYGGAGLFIRFVIKPKLPIDNLSSQLALIITTLCAAFIGALSGVSLHAAVGNFPWSVARDIFLPWMIGDGIGAMIVPPLLVPLLLKYFNKDRNQTPFLPSLNWLGFQLATILVAMFIAFGLPQDSPNLGSLWYIIVLPPIIFAVRGGIPAAATSIAMTTLLVPPLATYFDYAGERLSLQFILLIGAAVSLMIGGAITDRDRAFRRIKAHEEELEQQVEDRTKELKQSYLFQQHLMRSVGHDLQQPLFALNNFLTAITIGNRNGKLDHSIEQAVSICETASGFITKILDYTKREAGQITPSKSVFAIQKMFDQITPMFEGDANAKGLDIIIKPTDLLLNSDEHLLWEALANIVQNAIRLSSRGQQIEISANQVGADISIIVTDQIKSNIDVPGEAGFGLEIVRQISQLLDLEFELIPNQAKIFLK